MTQPPVPGAKRLAGAERTRMQKRTTCSAMLARVGRPAAEMRQRRVGHAFPQVRRRATFPHLACAWGRQALSRPPPPIPTPSLAFPTVPSSPWRVAARDPVTPTLHWRELPPPARVQTSQGQWRELLTPPTALTAQCEGGEASVLAAHLTNLPLEAARSESTATPRRGGVGRASCRKASSSMVKIIAPGVFQDRGARRWPRWKWQCFCNPGGRPPTRIKRRASLATSGASCSLGCFMARAVV